MDKTYISWDQFYKDIDNLSMLIALKKKPDAIVAIGRGGLIPATILSYNLNIKVVQNFQIESYEGQTKTGTHKLWQNPSDYFVSTFKNKNVLVVDDLADSGNTLRLVKRFFEYRDIDLQFVTLYTKKGTAFTPDVSIREYSTEEWIVFPWEEMNSACTPCNKQLYFNI
jgi:hypoxanthine phosphoribosyltransferase